MAELTLHDLQSAVRSVPRETLERRVRGHWPTPQGCRCGWLLPETARTQGPWRLHLVDVLTEDRP